MLPLATNIYSLVISLLIFYSIYRENNLQQVNVRCYLILYKKMMNKEAFLREFITDHANDIMDKFNEEGKKKRPKNQKTTETEIMCTAIVFVLSETIKYDTNGNIDYRRCKPDKKADAVVNTIIRTLKKGGDINKSRFASCMMFIATDLMIYSKIKELEQSRNAINYFGTEYESLVQHFKFTVKVLDEETTNIMGIYQDKTLESTNYTFIVVHGDPEAFIHKQISKNNLKPIFSNDLETFFTLLRNVYPIDSTTNKSWKPRIKYKVIVHNNKAILDFVYKSISAYSKNKNANLANMIMQNQDCLFTKMFDSYSAYLKLYYKVQCGGIVTTEIKTFLCNKILENINNAELIYSDKKIHNEIEKEVINLDKSQHIQKRQPDQIAKQKEGVEFTESKKVNVTKGLTIIETVPMCDVKQTIITSQTDYIELCVIETAAFRYFF